MSTHYSFHNARHHRHIRWLKSALAAVGVILLILSSWVLNNLLTKPADNTESAISVPRSSVQRPTTEVFRTPYFQFQTGDEWAEDARDSTQNKYVYRAYQGSLIQQDITIYVNSPTGPQAVPYVQPIKVTDDGLLQSTGAISDHCNKAATAGEKDDVQVRHEAVTFICDTDGTLFTVLVGVRGGSGAITLPRPGGGELNLIIIYRDLRAQPTGQDLTEIIKTFQSR